MWDFRPKLSNWRSRPVVLVASIACIGMAAVLGGDIGSFIHHSSAGGTALIHRARRAISAATPQACQRGGQASRPTTTAAGNGPRGLLEAPSLGMVAPVVAGTGDAVLSDAVGHVPASAWPGPHGTSVFAAHNVTWFSHIDALRPGDEIRYVLPCRTYVYRVTGHRVVPAGSPVYRTKAPRIVLDTCYPLNALYLTSSRYLVFARLVRTDRVAAQAARPAVAQRLTVPAPRQLVAQGLRLDQNFAPVGILRVTGSPSRAWAQSSAPIQAEAAALEAYFGLLHSASQQRRDWWEKLAPSVPIRAARGLWGGDIAAYGGQLNVTLDVHGESVFAATLTAVVTTSGSAGPGTYRLVVLENVNGAGKMLVTKFLLESAR